MNTRFNPTANGPLHLGHIYMALVNQAEAHVSGGKFICRIEDNQAYWCWSLGHVRVKEICDAMRADFDWLEIPVDEWLLQSEMEIKATSTMRRLLQGDLVAEHKFSFSAVEVPGSPASYFPYAPHLTAEKVVLDFLSGVNLLIRGVDLLSEHCLYLNLCDRMGLQYPRMVYLPRLGLPDGRDVQPEISKHFGNHKVSNYRKTGMQPSELLHKLRHSCLIDPNAPWLIANVKEAPTWVF